MGTITPFVPYPKGFVKYLPKITDRPYSKVEAGLCVMVDYDDQNPVTIRGYAKLWQWNKKTVSKFLKDHGAMIIYPKSTGNYKNQRGLIGILKRDQSGTNQGPIRFINNRDLDSNRNQSGTNKGPIRDQSVPPTIEPKPKPDPKKKETPEKSFSDNSIEMKISKYFFSVLLKSDPNNKKPDFQKWCKEVDYILRLDNRSTEDIKKVINYAHNPANSKDDFSWIPNLRSPKKLRAKFTTILLQCSGSKQDNGMSAAQKEIQQTQEYLNQ